MISYSFYLVRVKEQFSEEQPIPVPKGRVQQQRERLERLERAERSERWDRGRGAVYERQPLCADYERCHSETLAGETRLAYCELINNVDQCSHTLGKDGKFQLFICLATRYEQWMTYVFLFYCHQIVLSLTMIFNFPESISYLVCYQSSQ